jgi:4-nitrophenyl phosphatase
MTDQLEKLRKTKCFLMDMDGTIYLGGQLLPGAQGWLDLLDEQGIAYYILTNNSSQSRVEYAEKFTSLGLSIPQEKIFTSGEATAIYLGQHFPGAAFYVVGTPALTAMFQRHGLRLTQSDPDATVLGFDTTLTYDKLWQLCDLVVAGKPYIATHPDINCPTEDGFKPDIGAMIELVATSTGRRPDVIIGKPYQPIVDALVAKTGFPVEAHCMVGDRLYTDIALGRWGITTVLVLSGETQVADLASSEYQPDYVAADVGELTDLLKRALD